MKRSKGKAKRNRKGTESSNRKEMKAKSKAKAATESPPSVSGEETSDSESGTEIDCSAMLQKFVISLLNKAPKRKMLVSNLGLEITETFDESIKKLTGMKSRDFFGRMKRKKVIDIVSETTNHGSFDFAILRTKTSQHGVAQKHQTKDRGSTTRQFII